MRDCGINPVDGYHKTVKQGLCMEAKGWYYTRGPVCEDTAYITDEEINGPLCEEWRRKTGRPNPLLKNKK